MLERKNMNMHSFMLGLFLVLLLPSVNAAGSDISLADCDFEHNLCHYQQLPSTGTTHDDMDWTWNHGSTLGIGTGPSNDHTLGNANGHYIYTKSQWPVMKGFKATILSPSIQAETATSCLTFWYSMHGSATLIGPLEVRTATPHLQNVQLVWNMKGDQGKDWKMANITIDTSHPVEIIFTGTIGATTGDIGLDDITLTCGPCDGSCISNITSTTATTTTSTPNATTATPTIAMANATTATPTIAMANATTETPTIAMANATTATPTIAMANATTATPTIAMTNVTTATPTTASTTPNATTAAPITTTSNATTTTPTTTATIITATTTPTTSPYRVVADKFCVDTVRCPFELDTCDFLASSHWTLDTSHNDGGHERFDHEVTDSSDLRSPVLCNGPVHVQLTSLITMATSQHAELILLTECSDDDLWGQPMQGLRGPMTSWQVYNFTLPPCPDGQIQRAVFRVLQTSPGSVFMLDDIVLSTTGGCNRELECHFEQSSCGFNGSSDWTLQSGQGGRSQRFDNVQSDLNGLRSPVVCNGEVHVQFRSHVTTVIGQHAELVVLTECDGEDLWGQPLQGLRGPTASWDTYNFTLPACPGGQTQKVLFRVLREIPGSVFWIDDIFVTR